MYGRALMWETWNRRRFVPITHALFLVLYAGLCVLWSYPDRMQAGACIFIVSGLMLPLALSAGIFGNDMASGRFRTLVTEPVPLGAFYVYRVLGLMLQGLIHLAVVMGSVVLLHVTTGLGNMENVGLWLYGTVVLFIASASFCTAVSLLVKAEMNSLLAFLGLPAVFVLQAARDSFHTPFLVQGCDLLLFAARYALPPVELLFNLANDGGGMREAAGCGFHALGLVLVYGLVGLILLERREYKPQRS